MKLMLHVPKFKIRSDFWKDFEEFKNKITNNMYLGTIHFSLDIDKILNHLKDRIEPVLYRKYMGILEKDRTTSQYLKTYVGRSKKGVDKIEQENDIAAIEKVKDSSGDKNVPTVEMTKKRSRLNTSVATSNSGNMDCIINGKSEPCCNDDNNVDAEGRAEVFYCQEHRDTTEMEQKAHPTRIQNNTKIKDCINCSHSDSSNCSTTLEYDAIDIDLQNDQEGINQILVEWTKRIVLSKIEPITRTKIECKANEFKQCFNVATYNISPNFWHDLVEFMVLRRKKQQILNYSLDTKTILHHCKPRMTAFTYNKFLRRLKRARNTPQHDQVRASYKVPKISTQEPVVEDIETFDDVAPFEDFIIELQTANHVNDTVVIECVEDEEESVNYHEDESRFTIEVIDSSDWDMQCIDTTVEKGANSESQIEFIVEPETDSGTIETIAKTFKNKVNEERNFTHQKKFLLNYSSDDDKDVVLIDDDKDVVLIDDDKDVVLIDDDKDVVLIDDDKDVVLIETPIDCIDVTPDIINKECFNDGQTETSTTHKIEPDSDHGCEESGNTQGKESILAFESTIEENETIESLSFALSVTESSNDESTKTISLHTESVGPLVVVQSGNRHITNSVPNDISVQANYMGLSAINNNTGAVCNIDKIGKDDRCELPNDNSSINIACKRRRENAPKSDVLRRGDLTPQSSAVCEENQKTSNVVHTNNAEDNGRHTKYPNELRFQRNVDDPKEENDFKSIANNIYISHIDVVCAEVPELVAIKKPINTIETLTNNEYKTIKNKPVVDALTEEEECCLELVKQEEFISCEEDNTSDEVQQPMAQHISSKEHDDDKMVQNANYNNNDVYIINADSNNDDDDYTSVYSCHKCSKVFEEYSEMLTHVNANECDSTIRIFQCNNCLKDLFGLDNFMYHLTKCEYSEANSTYKSKEDISVPTTSKKTNLDDRFCVSCKLYVTQSVFKAHLGSRLHRENAAIFLKANVIKTSPPASEYVQRFLIVSNLKNMCFAAVFLENQKHIISEVLLYKITDFRFLKYNITLFGNYFRDIKKKKMLSTLKTFTTTYKSVRDIREIDHTIAENVLELIRLSRNVPNWSIVEFQYIEMNVCKLE